MANLSGFDANQVEPNTSFDPVPAGKYQAVITDSEMKPTKAGTGQYLELRFQIQGGEYDNRVLWSRLNLDNPNATAVKIAQADLSAICRAVGVMAPKDSVDLHNLPLVIQVGCKPRKDTGEITNEIKSYSKKESAPAVASAAQTSDNTPPWMRS
ncbi:DUF669 domain-containing protein [Bythopirellula polymerisocia]|uniref:DUF669 domain-containing protein n=1 Tax=Bythopirellula polymerisocia TaxID=2528003 RepID=A0A5C6CCI3_9BACT|nr:DUF669 domain-containing protein [Bythopirellula polymerisocia]TWU21812.1 hypothetical protein Pla144_45080 [Bythopirellula polymerisocia]